MAEKYRVEVLGGLHLGVTEFCASVSGRLEVIQKGNANLLFNVDLAGLAGSLTFDGQIPSLPAPFLGKSKDGSQAYRCQR